MTQDKKRRLAAIMFADIVGYTAMMQRNEKEGLVNVHRFSEVMEAQAKTYNGKVLEFRGDGCLVVFDSAVQAMHAAKAIQEQLQQAPVVPLRIGIHIGDIVFTKGRIYGDGVNLASRVESMGIPGSILVTERVIHDIKNHPEFEMISLGQFQFKNVEKPMEVFALGNEGLVVPQPGDMKGKGSIISSNNKINDTKWLKRGLAFGFVAVLLLIGLWLNNSWKNQNIHETQKDKPSIVVLPFDNLNKDSTQDYFSDGVADEIRSRLSRFSNLKTISRTSCMFYKGKQLPLQQIAEELGVTYILEGSVQRHEENLKISVQLTNAQTDETEWASPAFAGIMTDVFSFQEEIAKEVLIALKQKLSLEDLIKLEKNYTDNPEIYGLFLQAKNQLRSLNNPNALNIAEEILTDILREEPDYVPALHEMASILYWRSSHLGDLSDLEAKKGIDSYLSHIKSIDDEYPLTPALEGWAAFSYEYDFKKGERGLLKTVELGESDALLLLIIYYSKTGEFDKLKDVIENVRSLDPINPESRYGDAWHNLLTGQYSQAASQFEKMLREYPYFIDGYKRLAKSYNWNSQPQKALEVVNKGLSVSPIRFSYLLAEKTHAHHNLGQLELVNKTLSELEQQWQDNSGNDPAYFLGQAYAAMGNAPKALEWLEKSYEAREGELTWLKLDPAFKNLKGHPQYQRLLKQIGFPE